MLLSLNPNTTDSLSETCRARPVQSMVSSLVGILTGFLLALPLWSIVTATDTLLFIANSCTEF